MTKARRSGKVFLDWSQNAGSKTTIAPYSLRGRERPTVAAPVSWAEVEEGAEDPLGLEQLRLDEVLARVQEQGDLFSTA
jgi:bifunctional non-homologous end joining protein LigD